jgi:hypothetical protein
VSDTLQRMRVAVITLACFAGSPGVAWSSPTGPIEPQPAAAAPSRLPISRPYHRGRIPMLLGWSLFGGTYLLTATLGIVLHNNTRVCDDTGESCRRPGLHLLIPVIGPLFMTHDYGPTDSGPLFTAFDMLFQGAGVAVGIAGTVMYVRERKRRRAAEALTGLHLGRGVHLHAAPRLGGGMLQLRYDF